MKSKMKFLAMFLLVLMTISCSSTNNILKDINEIVEVRGITTIKECHEPIILSDDNAEKLIKQLKEYTYKRVTNKEEKEGFEYIFHITYKNKSGKENTVHITLLGDIATINKKEYKVENYDKKDFSDIF